MGDRYVLLLPVSLPARAMDQTVLPTHFDPVFVAGRAGVRHGVSLGREHVMVNRKYPQLIELPCWAQRAIQREYTVFSVLQSKIGEMHRNK